MDVEGHEIECIHGGRRVLSTCQSMLIEFWPDGIRIAGHSIADFWKAITDVGLNHIYLIDEFDHKVIKTGIHHTVGYCVQRGYSANLLCSRNERKDYGN
jgi:hypothetical protein